MAKEQQQRRGEEARAARSYNVPHFFEYTLPLSSSCGYYIRNAAHAHECE